jgi:hypothetical protein
LPISVIPLNPWQVSYDLLKGEASMDSSGQIAASRIASAFVTRTSKETMGWWHLSTAALTIWITRHWTAGQISATLAQEDSC